MISCINIYTSAAARMKSRGSRNLVCTPTGRLNTFIITNTPANAFPQNVLVPYFFLAHLHHFPADGVRRLCDQERLDVCYASACNSFCHHHGACVWQHIFPDT